MLKKYRNKNIGYMLYQQFERVVKAIGYYEKIAICEVVREEKRFKETFRLYIPK